MKKNLDLVGPEMRKCYRDGKAFQIQRNYGKMELRSNIKGNQ